MGKQTRRKHRSKRGPKQHTNKNAGPSRQEGSISTSLTPLLQRIRHADPTTRHAALTGLYTTLAAQPHTKTNKKEQQRQHALYASELLEAVRERIMDQDLLCAQAAAECMTTYVVVLSSSTTRNQEPGEIDDNGDGIDSTMAGWTLVLLERLQQCHSEVTRNSEDAMEQSSHPPQRRQQQQQDRTQQQWWALTARCLQTLCRLLETNPFALARLQKQPTMETTWMSLLLQLCRDGHDALHEQATVAHVEAVNCNDDVSNATTLTLRTLHSALDDNGELLEVFLQQQETATTTSHSTTPWQWFMEGDLCKNDYLPGCARLHAAGILVTARQLLVMGSRNGSMASVLETLHQQVVSSAVPLLHEYSQYPPSTGSSSTALLQNYAVAYAKYQSEQHDKALERSVIRAVDDRKEPARSIARRQKLQKEQQRRQEGDAVMQGKEENGNVDDDMAPATDRGLDSQDIMERASQAWSDSLRPLQLALEIVANLTNMAAGEADESNRPMDEDAIEREDDDDMMMHWGPDQEAELMARGGSEAAPFPELSPLDAVLLDAIVANGLPNGVLSGLRAVYTPMHMDDTAPIPSDAMDDLDELRTKYAACLGNCLSNASLWRSDEVSVVWQELRLAKERLSSEGFTEEALCTAMMLGMRSRPDLRKQIQHDDLEFLLTWLATSSSRKNIQRDIVSMVGVLCSEEKHPTNVNRTICRSLLTTLASSKSAVVTNEVLNALIDTYGGDDHTDVFDELQVLRHFQRAVPIFRMQIQMERLKAPEDEVEQWRETALNASRFISYTKGRL